MEDEQCGTELQTVIATKAQREAEVRPLVDKIKSCGGGMTGFIGPAPPCRNGEVLNSSVNMPELRNDKYGGELLEDKIGLTTKDTDIDVAILAQAPCLWPGSLPNPTLQEQVF